MENRLEGHKRGRPLMGDKCFISSNPGERSYFWARVIVKMERKGCIQFICGDRVSANGLFFSWEKRRVVRGNWGFWLEQLYRWHGSRLYCWSSEHAAPRYAIVIYWLFWIIVIWKIAAGGKSYKKHFFSLKARNESPMLRSPLYSRRVGSVLITS